MALFVSLRAFPYDACGRTERNQNSNRRLHTFLRAETLRKRWNFTHLTLSAIMQLFTSLDLYKLSSQHRLCSNTSLNSLTGSAKICSNSHWEDPVLSLKMSLLKVNPLNNQAFGQPWLFEIFLSPSRTLSMSSMAFCAAALFICYRLSSSDFSRWVLRVALIGSPLSELDNAWFSNGAIDLRLTNTDDTFKGRTLSVHVPLVR